MKYIELKSKLKEKIDNVYLISGDDRYLCFDALSKIKNMVNINIPDMNSVELSGDSVSAREIVDSANIYPFGDPFRMIVIKDFNPNKNNETIKILQDYFDEPLSSTILVFFNPNGADFFKNLKKFTTIDCNKLDEKMVSLYIQNFFAKNDIKANGEVIQKLMLFSLCDMTKITNELTKLASFVADTKTITPEIVDKFVYQDREFQIYELAEFLAKGDAENVFRLIDSFMIKPGSAFVVLSPLFNNYRRALYVSINKDKTTTELANLLGVKEFSIKMLSRQVKVFSPKQLKMIVDLIGEYDKKIKVGEMKENVAIKLIASTILKIRGNNG